LYISPSLGPKLGKLRLVYSLTLSILTFHFNIIFAYRLSPQALTVTFPTRIFYTFQNTLTAVVYPVNHILLPSVALTSGKGNVNLYVCLIKHHDIKT
jgi:hypothetical protein